MPTDLDSILRIEVPVIVRIAERSLSVRDVRSLAPGSIVELPKHADEELEVLVNNKPIGCGRAVKVGENFGLRITYTGPVKARLEAMAGGEATAAGGAETDAASSAQPEPEPRADSSEEALAG